ncbi:OprO/OprP family phosphate-selective porin [Frateuria edaphi]|uniref:OprO/OprP family phosphate-selective porin n=1 Tax=Frateuria edaphi TaxID=2898793 RepID=UPI001E579B41|nr:OprO/OprP family phosphate-selective porin [Frateuria edaphi]UGB47192.1 OprO/OprP family phosphate-selective porin [Frateuria edaphi]
MSLGRGLRRLALACLAALPLAGYAQDFSLHGYVDGRLVAAPSERSWVEGGLGKTRYGGGGVEARFGGAALAGTAQLTPSLLAFAGLQLQDGDRAGIDMLEAYLRWRPVSTTRWRGSVQAGAFFPPVSLENDAIGWTSPWTLTPSAINSWVGEELRAVGAEGRIERRGEIASWELRGALFQRNDPAGNLLAVRGWSLSDLTYGIGSRLREPDAYVRDDGEEPPMRYDPFRRIGHQWGNYAQLTWRARGWGRLSLMHYDNHADPQAWQPYEGGERLYAWRTRFWSLGATADTGPITWLAQAMDGDTVIEPVPNLVFTTRYRAAYLLAGWNRGAWRPALRLDHFSTRELPETPGLHEGEHGNAVTAALNWRPHDWLRLTFEVLHIDSTRTARADYGLQPRIRGTQTQLSARLFY